MATELAVQSERAFQKQPHVFLNSKKPNTERGKNRRTGKGERRWYKDVGLGFRTPKTAIDGNFIGMRDETFSVGIVPEVAELATRKRRRRRRARDAIGMIEEELENSNTTHHTSPPTEHKINALPSSILKKYTS